ncbi:MAG: NAD(P)H-dependent oxidoreductase subunit E [Gammaproteobacteria bacterium]|nr:NAD(P)H-dependent oxidoreductase subunit E [Gammaproteobacteria bacterium]
MNNEVQTILENYAFDKTRLIDILWDVQYQQGYISDSAVEIIADGLMMSKNDVRETLSFYHFFHNQPFGKHKIYLCNTTIAKMGCYQEVSAALQQQIDAPFGGTDKSGLFGLDHANCIGLSDQEPAMMVDNVVFTRLTANKVTTIISQLKQGKTAEQIANPDGFPSTELAYIESMVNQNIQLKGKVFFEEGRDYKAILQRCLTSYSPEDVISMLTTSGLRGRGGAGFSTGLKWQLGRAAQGNEKYIICNADEGEPGTFKDRVLLSHSAKDVLLGMITAAYAIGSRKGILYLRAEYWYLKNYLQQQIHDFHDEGLLGK